jgi:hypothetical protein
MAAFFLALVLTLVAGSAHAVDFVLATAGAPVAPGDAQQAQRDPFVPLSASQRHEIVREFKALLSMGLEKSSPERWVGRDVADCQKRTSSKDAFCSKCEVQMGDTHADYVFYPSGASCQLRDVEVVVDQTDAVLLKDLKPQAKHYAGSRDGQFYVEENEASGQSLLRFVWKRP